MGVVKFYGPVLFAEGEWVGVGLDTKTGRNNGGVDGIQYFEAGAAYGVFVR